MLNNPIGHRGQSKTTKRPREEAPAKEPGGASTSGMDFSDIPTIKTEPEPGPSKEPEAKKPPLIPLSRSRSPSPAVSKTSPGESRTPSGRDTPTTSTTGTPSSGMIKVAMRKAKIDALSTYRNERGGGKELINLVVVGHVDSGKSTLMGHLLYKLGSVNSKAMHKFEQESKKIGKQSFAYAWVLDETSEERERGITMDVGQNKFQTDTKLVTLLDAPGHKDFIPNMISGAYQADVAILVINATRGEFEAGFDAGGQTREHALLVRSLGVNQLAVAVNKLDTEGWRQDRFNEIVQKLKTFLKQVGFKNNDVAFVPCSGFTGDNLSKPSENLSSWYSGPTLLQAIDKFKPPERLVEKPFRMLISDVYKPQQSGLCVSGRIEAGFAQKDDKVLLSPSNELATVRGILIDDLPVPSAFAGDHVSLILTGPDQNAISCGMVACDPSQPIPSSKRFRARIVLFNVETPVTKGFPVVLHYGSCQAQAVIKKLVAQIDKSTGEVVKNKPRVLLKNCNAVVEIGVDSAICLELYSNIKELGRFMLRSGGKTIAAGLVTEILHK